MTALIVSLATPILGGMISLAIWQAKRNSIQVQDGLKNLHDCVHQMDTKVDEIQLDMAKNYCTKDELKYHMDEEADWHSQHHDEVKELRKEFNEKTNRLSHDVAEMKDMQWKMRMEQLDKKDKLI